MARLDVRVLRASIIGLAAAITLVACGSGNTTSPGGSGASGGPSGPGAAGQKGGTIYILQSGDE